MDKQQGKQQGKKGIEYLARAGYVAKGIVYFLVGILTAQAAFGMGGQTASIQEAIRNILTRPFGSILIWVVAIGLVGYAIWRLVQGIRDVDNKGTDKKGIVERTGMVISGITYLGFAYFAFRLAAGSSSSGSGGQQQQTSMVQQVMSAPFGRIAVGIVGLIVIAVGIGFIYRGWKAKFMNEAKTAEMRPKEQRLIKRLGQFGTIARGVVFMVIGYMVLRAAITFDASQATQGTQGAFRFLSQSAAGPWLMGVIALGFAAYGIFSLFFARYRKISIE